MMTKQQGEGQNNDEYHSHSSAYHRHQGGEQQEEEEHRSIGQSTVMTESTSCTTAADDSSTGASTNTNTSTRGTSSNRDATNGRQEQQRHHSSYKNDKRKGHQEGEQHQQEQDVELEKMDEMGIHLLSKIFPDLSREELEEIHYGHNISGTHDDGDDSCSQTTEGQNENGSIDNDHDGKERSNEDYESSLASSSTTTTPFTPRMKGQQKENHQSILKDNFLHIPTTTKPTIESKPYVHRQQQKQQQYNESSQSQNSTIQQMERNVQLQHLQHDSTYFPEQQHQQQQSSSSSSSSMKQIKSVVLYRDEQVGLGIQLYEYNGYIVVRALLGNDGMRITSSTDDAILTELYQDGKSSRSSKMGPAFQAGIKPGDLILGANGIPFLRGVIMRPQQQQQQYYWATPQEMLSQAADVLTRSTMNNSTAPIVLHLHQPNMTTSTTTTTPMHSNMNTDVVIGDEESIAHDSISEVTTYTTHTPSRISSSTRRQQHQHHQRQKEEKILDSTWEMIPPSTPPQSRTKSTTTTRSNSKHDITKLLVQKGVIQSGNDEIQLTKTLSNYNQRAKQWNSNLYLRIPWFEENNFSSSPSSSSPSSSTTRKKMTPSRLLSNGRNTRRSNGVSNRHVYPAQQHLHTHNLNSNSNYDTTIQQQHNNNNNNNNNNIYDLNPHIRQGLCVHIVNTFLDEHNDTAYTIWVFDVESQTEWYAPIRYLEDFKQLKRALSYLCSEYIDTLSFPTSRWFSSGGSSSGGGGGNGRSSIDLLEKDKNGKCQQLEQFLKDVCAMVYKRPHHDDVNDGDLNSILPECAIYIQTFLGCDTSVNEEDGSIDFILQSEENCIESSYQKNLFHHKEEHGPHLHQSQQQQDEVERSISATITKQKRRFKEAIQLYVYRVLLLPAFTSLISRFIEEIKKEAIPPYSRRMEEQPSQSSKKAEKQRILMILAKVKSFFSQLQGLIHDGCLRDFEAIISSSEFDDLHKPRIINNESATTATADWLDSIYYEAIREQLEIEVYVPLRSTISYKLVQGWREDDLEIQFKIQVLKKRPQSFFNIDPNYQSPSDWKRVVDILSRGVGQSTLPYRKLQAIVDAAKEIMSVSREEHYLEREYNDSRSSPTRAPSVAGTGVGDDLKDITIGADDFLPIFIFCVVRAEIERPCALCVLLRNLCDSQKQNGEIGYYLSTFESAIIHVCELDLTDLTAIDMEG